MPIASSLAAVVFGSTLAGAAAPVTSLPPVTINVSPSSTLSAPLVTRILDETDAVWRTAGFSFVWRRQNDAERQRAIDAGPCVAPTLRVVIGRGRAEDSSKRNTATTALGWIVFDDGRPDPEIYLSYDNAEAYLASARSVVGLTDRMPVAEREILLARAMGRALAHEIGHYLLASKLHSERGLMRATHTAVDFFGYERRAFAVDAAQRQAVVARLRHEQRVVSR